MYPTSAPPLHPVKGHRLRKALVSTLVVLMAGAMTPLTAGAVPTSALRTLVAASVVARPLVMPTPEVRTASTDPQAVGAYGGAVMVHAQVRDAYSCQLQLLSQQSFTVDFASNIRPCERPYHTINNYTAKVVIGPNTTMARRTVVFKLVVWYGPHRYAHGMVYIGVGPATTAATDVTTTTTPYANTPPTPPPSTGRGSSPVTATTVPGGDRPTRIVNTDNWAGYGVEGTSAYTGVRGAFNVPLLTVDDSATDRVDIWAGIGGVRSPAGVNDLIQAGVMESMVPCRGTQTYDQSVYSGGTFWVCPWTTVIEDGINTGGPVPDLTIHGGDNVRVVISLVYGNWEIGMMDDTTGQSWVGSVAYSGPGSSAEWIVENPGYPNIPCHGSGSNGTGQCALAPYSPAVAFTYMDVAPIPAPGTKIWDEYLISNGNAPTLAPNPLTRDASGNETFSVAYGLF